MKARTEHGKFVAAARALAVHGWARAYGGFCDPDRTLRIDHTAADSWRRKDEHWLTMEHLRPSGITGGEIFSARVASVQQAIDHLVVASVLPAEHASWTGSCEDAVLLDVHRYRWYRMDSGLYTEKLTGSILPRERLELTRGPLAVVAP